MAAYKALRKASVVLIEQLNLFETSLHLHAINGLTLLELQKLRHSYTTEPERKQYLVTTIIPSKGYYRGMMLLRRALKKSNQFDLHNSLKNAYDEAVNILFSEKLELPHTPESKHKTGSNSSVEPVCFSDITSAMFTGSSLLYRGEGKVQNRPISVDNDSSDESDDVLDYPSDFPLEQQQLQMPLPQRSMPTISLAYLPHRLRSYHVSYKTNPMLPVTVNVLPSNDSSSSDDRDKAIPVDVVFVS